MKNPAALRLDRTIRHPAFLVALIVIGGPVTAAVVWFVTSLSFVQYILADQFWFAILLILACIGGILGACAFSILVERKISAYTQDRYGPSRVGYRGLFQSAADGLKMLLKEDIIPGKIDRGLFLLAPSIAFTVSLLGFAIIPWAGNVHWPWMAEGATVSTLIADIDIGFLYLIAVASMGVYGVVLAGFASNNKYSFYGGIRAAAQMISYEIPLGLGLICILLMVGSLRLDEIVTAQVNSGLWFVCYQPLVFVMLLICGFAETNRAPFDLPECEQELVGGFHTEYSALKFGMFFLGEYAHMITGSALLIALFFGGYDPIPFWGAFADGGLLAENTAWWAMLIKLGVYCAKISVFILFYMLIRWTLPRFRFDQLRRVAWKGLIPIGMLLLLATSLLVVFDWHQNLIASLIANVVVLVIALVWCGRSKVLVTGRQENMPEIKVRPSM